MIPMLVGFAVFSIVAVLLLWPRAVLKLIGYAFTAVACWFVFSTIVVGYLASR